MEKQLEIAEPYGEVAEVGQVPGQIGFFSSCGRLSAQENKEPAVCSVQWAVI